jgi:type IV pilus assembly protein PilX
MNRATDLLNNEDGSLIVIVLMVLTLLTLVGTTGIHTANTEIEIATSELIYQTNFYLAEGAAMEAVATLENDSDPLTSSPDWLQTTPGAMSMENYTEDTYPSATATIDAQNDSYFKVAYEGITAGSSKDMSKSRLHDFTIYGRSEKRGTTEVRIGYRKVF